MKTVLFVVYVKPDDSIEICVDGYCRNSSRFTVDCTTDGGATWVNMGIVLNFPGGLAFDKALESDRRRPGGTISGGGVTIPCPGTDCVNIAFDQDTTSTCSSLRPAQEHGLPDRLAVGHR